ncbi:hypothetical protein [Paenibacillus sp. NAIST15-1]|uniref:hypothetical protein n=1 Tax=Paenibacillus sp. NAIST15-1 TaxID=1605994 RepID=UPI001115293C|nr:hypothetical protein [Paenibacillus sp. NAIST15-1]
MQLSFRNHDSERLQGAGNKMAVQGMMKRERVTQTGVRIDVLAALGVYAGIALGMMDAGIRADKMGNRTGITR